MSAGDYRAVAVRTRQELVALQEVTDGARGAWADATGERDDYHVDATALNLHGFYAGLERFLGFRHVVRNVYAYVLDPRRVGELLDVLPGTFASVRSQLADFAQTDLKLVSRTA